MILQSSEVNENLNIEVNQIIDLATFKKGYTVILTLTITTVKAVRPSMWRLDWFKAGS